jgi:hypothetical protein
MLYCVEYRSCYQDFGVKNLWPYHIASMPWSDSIRESLSFLDNKWVAGTVTLLIVLYAGLAAPNLPATAAKLFRNKFFNLLVIFMIAYLSIHRASVSIAIMLAMAFVLSILSTEKQVCVEGLREHFAGQELPAHIDWAARVPDGMGLDDSHFVAADHSHIQGFDETAATESMARV